MNKLLDVLQEKMVPIAYKLDQNRYLTAVKSGFFGAMPILIIGSIFLLLANLPIPGYEEMMASILGESWTTYFMVPYEMSMNIMTLFVIVGISRQLSKHYQLDDLSGTIIAMVGFLVLTPTIANEEGASGIPMLNLGASGLFIGMIAAILGVEIFRWVTRRGWTIKMPESVPANVSKSFSALIPAFFVILIFNFIRIGFSFTPFETAHQFVFQILQRPLLALGGSLPALWVIIIFEMILWSFGIHGSNIIGAVMTPIWLTLTVENADAFANGLPLPNIINSQFYGNYIKLGGAGATIGLAILCTLFAKSSQFKTLGRLSFAPGLFNINEPLVFGIPIVLNPLMMPAFILTPLIMATVSYAAMATGIVPYPNGANIPWTTPPIFSGLLLSGWRGAALQVFNIGVAMAIYFPFFRILDKQAYEQEAAIEDISLAEGSLSQ